MGRTSEVWVTSTDGLAIVSLARPPGNAMSVGFCREVESLLLAALNDGAVRAIVLASALPVFSAGSDLAEMVAPRSDGRTALVDLCRLIARADKPIVAAVSGMCLSSGFDVVLACEARVCSMGASFGYPDIILGLMPAGGGVYRLAKLIGAKAALDMLLSGGAKTAQQALALGLVDEVVAPHSDVDRAAALAQHLAQMGDRRARAKRLHRLDYAKQVREDLAVLAQTRQLMPQVPGPWQAQHRMIALVEGAFLLPEDIALTQEKLAYDEVYQGPIARALTYAFVAHHQGQADQRRNLAQAQGQQAAAVAMLHRVLAEVTAHFCAQGMAKGDVMQALGSFGIAVDPWAALPDCPKGGEDVVAGLLAAWANAGARMLRMGAVARADCVDFAALTAAMCPNWRGGPMYMANLRGACAMRRDLAGRAGAGGSAALFAPDPLWDQLIAQNQALSEYRGAALQAAPPPAQRRA